jgi:Tol biopolymer transport system component
VYQLWLRPVGSVDARPLAGTDDGTFPFWSPDSRYIAFFAEGKLKKVAVAGGPPVVLCAALAGRGGTWNRDNVILFSASTTEPLQRVSGAGGIPQPASALDTTYGESSHRFPSFLPDGRHFIFSAIVGTCCPAAKDGRIRVGALDSTDTAVLLEGDSSAMYSRGHLLFHRLGTLMAAPFDVTARRLTADSFPVADQVASEGSRYGSFSASDTGTLVYARGIARPLSQLTWFDRAGKTTGTVGPPAPYISIALSPDERHVATAMATAAADIRDIWTLDVANGTPARFTFEPGASNSPIWSPDGRRIVFSANRGGRPSLRVKRTDGSATEEPLFTPDDRGGGALAPSDWSADGRYVVYSRTQGVGGSSDIWALPVTGDGKNFPVAQTTATESNAVISPDGRWIAYQSTETAQPRIYVQPFPPTGGQFQVSTGGGYNPLWRRDGKELFFLSQDGRIMAAPVGTAGGFHAGAAVALFAAAVAALGTGGRQIAVTNDGRFLVNVFQRESTTTPLTVVVNWLAAVQK